MEKNHLIRVSMCLCSIGEVAQFADRMLLKANEASEIILHHTGDFSRRF